MPTDSPPSPTTERRRGILIAFLGMAGVSSDSLFTRLADTDGFTVTFWVGLLTAVVMACASVIVDRASPLQLARRAGWPLAAAGLLQGVSTACFVLAVKHTSVSNVVVIVAATPMFAAAVSWAWMRERTERRVWWATLASFLGIAVVVSGSRSAGAIAGDLLAVGAIGSFSVGLVLLRRAPGLNRRLVVGMGGLAMAILSLAPARVTGHPLATWLSLVAMGAVVGPLARLLLATAPRYLPAAEVGLFAPLETVLASLWAFLAFGEAPVATTWVGGTVVLGSLLWGVWPREPGASPATALTRGSAP